MNKKELNRALNERHAEEQLRSLEANRNRAQSVSIGMSGSGTTEITMRGIDGTFLWNIYQPVQVTEFIHQLAASIGCHIHLQPRKDFASWREWNETTEEERMHLNGFPPFAQHSLGHEKVGLVPQHIPQTAEEQEHVATKKAVNKRTTKRSRASSK
jgi:hypothetical protein